MDRPGHVNAKADVRVRVRARSIKHSLECFIMSESCDLLCLDLPVAEALRRRAKQLDELADSARLHSALGDELRLAMLTSLAEGELCGCDLSWIHEKSQSLISHHMKTLLAAGLTESRREGKIVFFALTETGARFAPHLEAGARR